jgi:Cys-tRNA(Pro)/Cys-tRNA(Cys) deacylase
VQVLVRAGIGHRLHRVGHDPSVTEFGWEAAEALAVEPGRVFKTLVCSTGVGLVVAVVPVTGELNLKSVATAVGTKSAEMADPMAAQRATGYVVGGISPIGQKGRLATLVDQTASSWDTIFVSGGHRGLEVELAPGDLLAVTGGRLAPIGRPR